MQSSPTNEPKRFREMAVERYQRRVAIENRQASAASVREVVTVLVVLVLLVVGLLAMVALVDAQPSEPRVCPEAPRPVILARLTWHEAGVDALIDASAIHEAITGLALVRRESWEESACAYSGRALRGETVRSWISLLDESGIAPDGFPHARSSWPVSERLFGRLLTHAALVVDGDAEPACEVLPTDWGHPVLDSARIERGIARGYWRRVSCPGARGTYLRRAELDDVEAELAELEHEGWR